jgi:hypothetical protein
MTLLIRPLTLDSCQPYVLRVVEAAGDSPVFLPARFISYQPCPALVIVRLLQEDRSFCKVARDDLFSQMLDSSIPGEQPDRLRFFLAPDAAHPGFVSAS